MTFIDKFKSICGRKEFLMCSNALVPPTSSKITLSDPFTTALCNLLPEMTTDTPMHNFSKAASMCGRPHWSQGNNHTAQTKYCFDWNININNSDAVDDEFEPSKHSPPAECNSLKHLTPGNTEKTGQHEPSEETGLIITAQERQTCPTGSQRRLSGQHLLGPEAGEQSYFLEEIFSTRVFCHSLSDMDGLPCNGESRCKVNFLYNRSSDPRYVDLRKTTSLPSCLLCLEGDQPHTNWSYLTSMKLRIQQVGKSPKTHMSFVSEGMKECQDTEQLMDECLDATNLNRFNRSVPLFRSKSFPGTNRGPHIEKSTVIGDYWIVQSGTGQTSREPRRNSYCVPGRHWNDAVDLNVGNSQSLVDEERKQELERTKQFYQDAGVLVQGSVRPPPARRPPIDLDMFSIGQVSLDILHKPSPKQESRLSLSSYPPNYGKRIHFRFTGEKQGESPAFSADGALQIGSKTRTPSKKSAPSPSGVTQADSFVSIKRKVKQEEDPNVHTASKTASVKAFKDFVKRIVQTKKRKSKKPGRFGGAAPEDRFIRSSYGRGRRVRTSIEMLTRRLSTGRSSGPNRKKPTTESKRKPEKPRYKTGSSYVTLPEVVQKTGPTQLVRAQTSQPGAKRLQVQRPTKGFAKFPAMTRSQKAVGQQPIAVKSTALSSSKAKSSANLVDQKPSQESKQGEDGADQHKPKPEQGGELESENIPEGPEDQKLRESSTPRLSKGNVSISKGPIVSGPPSEVVIPDKQLHDRSASSEALAAPQQTYTEGEKAKGSPERPSLTAIQDPSSIQEPDDSEKPLLDAHPGKPSAGAAYETEKVIPDETEPSGGSGIKVTRGETNSVKYQVGTVKTAKRQSTNKDARGIPQKRLPKNTKPTITKQNLATKTQRQSVGLRKPQGESSGFVLPSKSSVKLAMPDTPVNRKLEAEKPSTTSEAKDSIVEQPIGLKDTDPYPGIVTEGHTFEDVSKAEAPNVQSVQSLVKRPKDGLQPKGLTHQEVSEEKAKFILEKTDVSAYRSPSRMESAAAAEERVAGGLRPSVALQVLEVKPPPLAEKSRSLPIDTASGARSSPAPNAKLKKETLGNRNYHSASDAQEVLPKDTKNKTTDQKSETIHPVAGLSGKEEKPTESQDARTDYASQLQTDGVPRKSRRSSAHINRITSSLVDEPSKITWSIGVKKTTSQQSGDIQATPMSHSITSIPTTITASRTQSTETSFQDSYVCDTNYFMPPY
ncbi:hypothetical protein CRM22_004464 [Opisthorchis felineus]|nr:hypothetical protein CRM22_004464 [Opisthorchis felineus]